MAVDFHRDMDNYLSGKRRKKLISDIKNKIMNKKSLISSKTTDKLGELKGKVKSSVERIKKKEPKKVITQKDIDKLVQKEQKPDGLDRLEEEGWEEVKLETAKLDFTGLEEKKKKIEENLARLRSKEETEKEKIAKLAVENEERKVSEEDKAKQMALAEEINVLKDKQRMEEERLAELRRARRKEQMEALRGRVTDILFKKNVSHKKIIDEIKKEAKEQAEIVVEDESTGEIEGPKEAAEKKIQEVQAAAKAVEKKIKEAKASPQVAEQEPELREEPEAAQKNAQPKAADKKPKEEPMKTEEPLKTVQPEVSKPKRSFFSNFIEIKTSEEIAKEEENLLRIEEEAALKDQIEVQKMFQEEGVEVKTNIPDEGVDLSTLFPENPEHETKEEVLELDQGYKIRVVRNE